MFRFVYFIAVTLLGSVVFLSAPLSATPAIHHLPTDTLHADALGPFKGDFAEIRVAGKSRYLHRSGKVVVDKPVRYGAPVCIAVTDGAYGAINSKGDVIADFIYDDIRYEYDDKRHPGADKSYHYFLAIVQLDGKVGAIDTLGKTVAEPVYDDLRPINAHVLAAQKAGKWGLLSLTDGGEVLPFTYDDLTRCYVPDGYLEVTAAGKKGLRSPDGKREVMPAVYDDLMGIRLDGGPLLLGQQGNEIFLLDTLGKRLTMEQYDRMSADGPLVRIERGGKTGWLAADGSVRILPIYDDAADWVDGRCIVTQNGKKGVLADDGQLIVPCQYSDIKILDDRGRPAISGSVIIDGPPMIPGSPSKSSGQRNDKETTGGDLYFMARAAGKYNLFNRAGKKLLPMEYDGIQFGNTGARSCLYVVAGERYGLADLQGKELLPVSYRFPMGGYSANVSGTGPASIIRIPDGESIGLYDLERKHLLLPPEYEQLEWQLGCFIKATSGRGNGNATADPVSAYFRADGSPLIPPTKRLLVHAVDTDRYVVTTRNDSHWSTTLFDADGKQLYHHPQWDFSPYRLSKQLMPDSISRLLQVRPFQGGLLKVGAEKNLFVDRQGKEVRFEGFDFVDDFFGGLAAASRSVDGKALIGIIDSAGNVVLPLEYHGMDKIYNGEMRKIWRNDNVGVIDLRGRVILEAAYEAVDYLKQPALFQVRLNGKAGLVGLDGATVLPTEYDHIRLISDSLLRVEKDGKSGFASSTGKVLVAPRYEEARLNDSQAGYFPARVKVGGRWTYVQADGTELPVSAGDKLGY